MNTEKRQFPVIRFPEFINKSEWNKKTLGDLLNVNSGKDYKHLQPGDIPVYGTGGYMLSVNDRLSDIDAVGIGRKGTIDKPQYLKAPFWTVDTLFYLTTKGDDILKFIFYLLQTIEWRRYSEQTGVPSLTRSSIERIDVKVPNSIEQQKIADCLSSIDSYISSINEKIEQLKAHKKSLMQKLFPQNGKTIPEYRFPEFEKDGAWVEIKVSDIFEITRGHVLAASNTKSAPDDEYRYPVFSSQTAKNGLMGYYNKPLYTDAITWTTDGANAGTVNYREGPFYCTNVCGVLLSNKGYANKCIAELLSMEAKKHVSYVGNPKLMNNVMAEIKLYIPSIREQHRIASCLSSIDMLRQVNTEKRVQLEKIKKGLVQHLFPQI